MLKPQINLYRFDELTTAAREKALEEHRYFMLEMLRPDYIDGVCDWNDEEKMEMYRDEYDYILRNDEPVIENIEINEYYFYFDGSMCNVCHYTGGPKKGTIEIKIHGETFTIMEEK